MTKLIIKSSMILALLITMKLIEKVIPNLPSGLGDVSSLVELTIILSSIAIGFKETIVSVLIFLIIISWISPSIFIGGVIWTKNAQGFLGVYFLDYFLPLILISFAGAFNFEKNIFVYLWVSFLLLLNYLSHSFAGVIFWKSYAWNNWGVYAYSFTANLVKFSILFVLTNTMIPLALLLKKKYNKKNQDLIYW